MSQRKSNTKSAQDSLETRAECIINTPMKYDADARDRVAVALSGFHFHQKGGDQTEAKRYEQQLKDLVQKAEAGEPLNDVEGIGREYVEAARLVYEFVTADNNVPDFIYQAVTVALDEAQRQTGCELWFLPHGCEDTLENYGYSIERMARLFRHNSMLKIKVEPKKSLAEMIAAVVEHEDCPEEIRGALNAATSDLFNRLNEGERRVFYTASYLHALIMEAKAQEERAS